MIKKKAQAGVEYMIIIGFVTFAVMTILVIATVYSGLIKDKIRANQIESFSIQLVNHAESVFFSGEPSLATIRLYLPVGVEDITINTNDIVVTFSSSSGQNIRAFTSRVSLQGTIVANEGLRTIRIEAKSDHVLISN